MPTISLIANPIKNIVVKDIACNSLMIVSMTLFFIPAVINLIALQGNQPNKCVTRSNPKFLSLSFFVCML